MTRAHPETISAFSRIGPSLGPRLQPHRTLPGPAATAPQPLRVVYACHPCPDRQTVMEPCWTAWASTMRRGKTRHRASASPSQRPPWWSWRVSTATGAAPSPPLPGVPLGGHGPAAVPVVMKLNIYPPVATPLLGNEPEAWPWSAGPPAVAVCSPKAPRWRGPCVCTPAPVRLLLPLRQARQRVARHPGGTERRDSHT
jgi:hypothetical protein